MYIVSKENLAIALNGHSTMEKQVLKAVELRVGWFIFAFSVKPTYCIHHYIIGYFDFGDDAERTKCSGG